MSVDTPDWVRDAVFYQIFPDRFAASSRVVKPGPLEPWDAPPTNHGFKGGDLLGIVERLDYLQDLGVNALYLNPIFTSASNHRYHTDDYEHVDPMLGGDEALRELFDAVHARGMHVVLDGVFNHSGRGWFPFHHVVENGADSPYRDWFHIDGARMDARTPLNAFPTIDQEAEARRIAIEQGIPGGEVSERFYGYRGWWDLPALPKIRVEHPVAREYLMAIGERWLSLGADGWRLDVPEEIDIGFWREFRTRVRAAKPTAYLVGEIWHVHPEWVAGDVFDSLMDYPLTEALIGFCGAPLLDWDVINAHDQYRATVRPMDGAAFAAELERLLGAYDAATVDSQFNLLGSHDTARFVTVCGGDSASYRLATLIQMTLPGAPCIYYGDEVGMAGRNDPGNRGAFPADPAAWDMDLHDFVRSAVALRREHAALRAGAVRVLGASESAVAYLRSDTSESFVIAVNAGVGATDLTFDSADLRRDTGQASSRLAIADAAATVVDGTLTLHLPPRSGLAVKIQ